MSTGTEPTATMSTQPVDIKKTSHHWWQDIPRRLSLTHRSNSETNDGGSPIQSPTTTGPTPAENQRTRRFSEASAHSYEKSSEIRERWNKNYNIPPECFVPPWI